MEDALIKAIQEKDTELVDAVLKTKLVEPNFLTARFLGKYGTPELIDVLTKNGTDLSKLRKDENSDQSLLYYACAFNDAKLAKYLMEHGFSPLENLEPHGKNVVEYFRKNPALRPVLQDKIYELNLKNQHKFTMDELTMNHWKRIFNKVLKELKQYFANKEQWKYVMAQVINQGPHTMHHYVMNDIPSGYKKMQKKMFKNEIIKKANIMMFQTVQKELGFFLWKMNMDLVHKELYKVVAERNERDLDLRIWYLKMDSVHEELLEQYSIKRIEQAWIGEWKIVWEEVIQELVAQVPRRRYCQIAKLYWKRSFNLVLKEMMERFSIKEAFKVVLEELKLTVEKKETDKELMELIREQIEAGKREFWIMKFADVLNEFKVSKRSDERKFWLSKFSEVMKELNIFNDILDERRFWLSKFSKVMMELNIFNDIRDERRFWLSKFSEVMEELKAWSVPIDWYENNAYSPMEVNDEVEEDLEINSDDEVSESTESENDIDWTVVYDQIVHKYNELQKLCMRTFVEMMKEDEVNLLQVKDFVKSGFNCVAQDENGTQPIHWSACFGDVELTDYLVQCGANVNEICDHEEGSITPLIFASIWNNLAVADYLMKQGAFINYTDKQGRSALTEATSPEMIKMIEKHLLNKLGIVFDPTTYLIPSQEDIMNWSSETEFIAKRRLLNDMIDKVNRAMCSLWGQVWFHPNSSVVKKWHDILKNDLANLKRLTNLMNKVHEEELVVLEDELDGLIEEAYERIEATVLSEDSPVSGMEPVYVERELSENNSGINSVEEEDYTGQELVEEQHTVTIEFEGDTSMLVNILKIIRDALDN